MLDAILSSRRFVPRTGEGLRFVGSLEGACGVHTCDVRRQGRPKAEDVLKAVMVLFSAGCLELQMQCCITSTPLPCPSGVSFLRRFMGHRWSQMVTVSHRNPSSWARNCGSGYGQPLPFLPPRQLKIETRLGESACTATLQQWHVTCDWKVQMIVINVINQFCWSSESINTP